jgi:hypothetical protein
MSNEAMQIIRSAEAQEIQDNLKKEFLKSHATTASINREHTIKVFTTKGEMEPEMLLDPTQLSCDMRVFKMRPFQGNLVATIVPHRPGDGMDDEKKWHGMAWLE